MLSWGQLTLNENMISSQKPAFAVFMTTCLIALSLTTKTTQAQNLTPHLDQYSYLLNGHVSIDLSNQIVSFASNMTNCQQANGNPPLDTGPTAVFTNGQFIGIKKMRYDIYDRTVGFISETGDLSCDNGVFVEVLFAEDFQTD